MHRGRTQYVHRERPGLPASFGSNARNMHTRIMTGSCVHTCRDTPAQVHLWHAHTQAQGYTHPQARATVHTHTNTHRHVHTHSRTRALTGAETRVFTQAPIHTQGCPLMHAHPSTNAHAHACTHTIQKPYPALEPSFPRAPPSRHTAP